jgi:hypothetical protein
MCILADSLNWQLSYSAETTVGARAQPSSTLPHGSATDRRAYSQG